MGGRQMAISYEELTTKHPCFAKDKNSGNGRIHLPISPSCNIECKFCERSFNTYEQRPGVTSKNASSMETCSTLRRPAGMCMARKES